MSVLTVPASPEAFDFCIEDTALIVVDMQNAYASKGGYVDLAGFDISGARICISNIQTVLAACRRAGVLVTYLQNGWDAAYQDAGGPLSPNLKKSNAFKTMRKKPELWGTLLAKGGWDYEMIDELLPEPGDLIIPKPRYSGFFNSSLDSAMRSRGIRNLVFVGIATNVCVESTLRDAFHLEYSCLMLEDATNQIGPDFIREATIFNVSTFFGWVGRTEDFCTTLKAQEEEKEDA
ncbi:MAG: isochorismatase family protein [Pseudomonadota bacterium]